MKTIKYSKRIINLNVIFFFIFLLIINSCSSTRTTNLNFDATKNIKYNNNKNYSCSGKGKITSTDFNTLSFRFESKKDSSFIQFLDPLGRKALLMWITPNAIIARNLIENKQYNDSQLLNNFPFDSKMCLVNIEM